MLQRGLVGLEVEDQAAVEIVLGQVPASCYAVHDKKSWHLKSSKNCAELPSPRFGRGNATLCSHPARQSLPSPESIPYVLKICQDQVAALPLPASADHSTKLALRSDNDALERNNSTLCKSDRLLLFTGDLTGSAFRSNPRFTGWIEDDIKLLPLSPFPSYSAFSALTFVVSRVLVAA
jgi:hypothetical protein